ncbi:MAG TPA: DUF1206 domain-containing protein [Marisediminicola sp.]|nr:DUF1206 domain-containing protein [Marisediminicola sp.]
MTDRATGTARTVSNNRYFQVFARGGYAVNAVLHLLIGGIAIGVASGAGGKADQSGALESLASRPGGVFMLWAVVVGLVALGLWQTIEAILVPMQEEKRKWARRVIELGKAVAYFGVAATAFTFASGGSSSSSSDTQSFSATLIATPAGVVLLVTIGLAVVVIGGYFCAKGAKEKFREDIAVPSGKRGTAIVTLGKVGYIAKGIALAIVGILFVIAAVTSDSSRATGLDGALKALVELPFGAIILGLVGAGFVAFGLYSFARARSARL